MTRASCTRSIAVSVILATLLVGPAYAVAQARHAGCTIRGEGELPHVRVRAGREPPLELALRGLGVALTPMGAGRALVRTTSGLVIEGTMPEAEVPIALAREARVADGVLTLRPGTAVAPERLALRRVAVDLAPEVRVESVVVPCDSLRVGLAAPASELPADAPQSGALRTRGASIRVSARPGGRSLTITARELRLAELERRPRWVRVRRDFADGSTLLGWVRDTEVERVDEEAFAAIGEGSGFGSLGLCGTGGRHGGYSGPATLVAGAEVLYSAGGPAWARAEADVAIESVRVVSNGEWAQIWRIAGFRDYESCTEELDHAWVRVASLRFPHGARGVPASQVEPAPDASP